ncbi:MAG: bifunctional diaminohydroxyphosphoribosylaminopyrimidine deaminase/5-amino-6-(5-phosphoribosylamino)uracil reductase RibD [Phycisphaerae bacterium]|nr:bifunctional diaminohydroxyphosphoribosylaminopyrimidine deaminase/5-amino-6-(5-phosphoribosylamino)uracil reductase RibD [Phycisphaerae bacterium]
MPNDEEMFMRRALALAERGRGAVEPNPMVGAVLVRGGQILAEGFHQRFGGPHAEIEALDAARQAGADPTGATMYVTLEPCCHHGKTPPCTDAILRARVGRVVAAMRDPDENVAGRGLAILRDAGVDVSLGLCESEARELLGPYIKLRTQHLPWCIAKWAQTADGFLALPNGEGRWISSQESRRRVHELRSRCDGVLVGVGTVQADDPLLTNRSGQGRTPTRVVLDSHLRTPPACRLVQTANDAPLLIATIKQAAEERPEAVLALQRHGAEVLPLPADDDGRVSLPALLEELGRREWTNLLVEGGETVLRAFLAAGLFDELQVYVSPRLVGPADLPRLNVEDVLAGGAFSVRQRISVGDDAFLHCGCV